MVTGLDVQIRKPDESVEGPQFILGENVIGDPLSDSDLPMVWESYKPPANALTFTRGGDSGDLNALDVGLLSLVIPNADPLDVGFEPGRAIRAGSDLAAQTIEAGVSDANLSIQAPNDPRVYFYIEPGELGDEVTLEWDDEAEQVTIATTGTVILLAVRFPSAVEKFTQWRQRPDTTADQAAYLRVLSANQIGATVTVGSGNDPAYTTAVSGVGGLGTCTTEGPQGDPAKIIRWQVNGTGTGLEVTLAANDLDSITMPLAAGFSESWSGKVTDLDVRDRLDGSLGIVSGADPIATLSNTMIDGAPTDGQTFYERALYLADLSPIPFDISDDSAAKPIAAGGTRDAWTPQSAGLHGNITVDYDAQTTDPFEYEWATAHLRCTYSGSYNQGPGDGGIELALDGLQPGHTYRITGRVRLGADLSTGGDNANVYWVTASTGERTEKIKCNKTFDTEFELDVTADTASLTLHVGLAEVVARSGSGVSESLYIGDVFLVDQQADTYQLADTNLKASLTEHLNLLCDSVGGLWRVTTTGRIVLARSVRPQIRARFSDVDKPSYTSLSLAYSTADVVNVLDVQNLEGEVSVPHSFTDAASAGRWGARSRPVRLNLAETTMVEQRAAEILAERNAPQRRPSSLTYLQEDVDTVLDVHDGVVVVRKGTEYRCIVLGTDHNTTATGKHRVALTLRSI